MITAITSTFDCCSKNDKNNFFYKCKEYLDKKCGGRVINNHMRNFYIAYFDTKVDSTN